MKPQEAAVVLGGGRQQGIGIFMFSQPVQHFSVRK